MAHNIALNFEDGVTRFVECRPGETVADASYRAGINIPLDCRDGACGTCKCHAQSGEYDGGSYIEDALTDEEAARALRLPARCGRRPTLSSTSPPHRRCARPRDSIPGEAERGGSVVETHSPSR